MWSYNEKKIIWTFWIQISIFICILPDVPSAPGKPEVHNIQKTSMKLTWTQPEHDGGKPIEGYYLEIRENFAFSWTRKGQLIEDSQYQISDLTEGSTYEFRVLAKNEIGVSKPSEPTHPPRIAIDPSSKFFLK